MHASHVEKEIERNMGLKEVPPHRRHTQSEKGREEKNDRKQFRCRSSSDMHGRHSRKNVARTLGPTLVSLRITTAKGEWEGRRNRLLLSSETGHRPSTMSSPLYHHFKWPTHESILFLSRNLLPPKSILSSEKILRNHKAWRGRFVCHSSWLNRFQNGRTKKYETEKYI